MRRPAVAISVLAVAGLVVAAGIGLLVNAVSGDSIGLAAQPLSAGSLAPPSANDDKHREQGRGRGRGGNDRAASRQQQASHPPVPSVPSDDVGPEAPKLELSDDHGGNSSGGGDPGGGDSGNSGSGSDSSGSDSSGSGSGDD
jgi:hypothetical protein